MRRDGSRDAFPVARDGSRDAWSLRLAAVRRRAGGGRQWGYGRLPRHEHVCTDTYDT